VAPEHGRNEVKSADGAVDDHDRPRGCRLSILEALEQEKPIPASVLNRSGRGILETKRHEKERVLTPKKRKKTKKFTENEGKKYVF